MAEKKKTAAKKKNPRFGGKRDLKDTSGNKKIGFEDTFLGDLLGFDGKMGTKGKPGLLASLKGARRKKPGAATTTKGKGPAKVRPVLRPKADAKGPVRRGDGTGAGVKTDPRPTNPGIPRTPPPRLRDNKPPRTPRQTENKKLFGLKPFKPLADGERRISNEAGVAAQKKNMKQITFEQWQSMSSAQRKTYGLPKSAADAKQNGIATPQFKNSKKRTSPGGGQSSYLNWAALSTGMDNPTKPNAKPGASGYNKGGMTKKKGYAAGGMPMVMKAGKKVPSFAADGVGKMNMGGMAKKKPAAKMMAGGMAKKKPTAKMMGGGMAKSGYMYGGSVTKKKPVTKMNKGGMTKKK